MGSTAAEASLGGSKSSIGGTPPPIPKSLIFKTKDLAERRVARSSKQRRYFAKSSKRWSYVSSEL
jgi:hypothetical protein